MQDQNTYVPGVCNIGKYEIEKRQKQGLVYLIIALIFPYFSYYFGFHPALKLLVFFPAIAATISFMQIYFKFCAFFGFSGLYNVGDLNDKQKIESAEAIDKDTKKAYQLIFYSVMISLVYTTIVLFFF